MLWFTRLTRPLGLSGKTLRWYSTTSKEPLVLRPYQISCVEACLDALESGTSRIGVSLPTGSGKTTVFMTLLSRIQPPAATPKAKRSLVIVNSIELARQAAASATRLCPGWRVEIEQGAKHHASGTADVTIATYQTLLQSNRLAKFKAKGMKAIIVDEAHHAAAPSYRHILSHFHADIKSPEKDFVPPVLLHNVPILGFSATFGRHDGLALGSVFEQIVYHRDFLEMISDQWLCHVRFTSVRADIDMSNIRVTAQTGDFQAQSLAHVINTPTLNSLVVQTWLDRAAERRSTLVFCVNLAHVRDLTQAFRDVGVDARYIYSGTPPLERRALVEQFKAGGFPVLVNCAVLTEGADIPNIDCVIIARPTRSRNVFSQMIGRGMRLSPETGKTDCRIIDFVDSTNSVSGIVSTPTLFGLDPNTLIDDETTESLEELAAKKQLNSSNSPESPDPIAEPKSVTYIDYDDPFELAEEASGAPHIRKFSPHAWVGCGEDVYVLELLGKGFIRVERDGSEDDSKEHFTARYTPATLPMATAMTLKISPFQKSRKILEATSLIEAIRGCDTYAKKVVPAPQSMGLRYTARWRQQPASESQRAFVANRWRTRTVILGNTRETEERLAKLTKGEAANIITRLKHGAQKRYEKKSKQQQTASQARTKEEMRKAREHVKVGPLPA
ncbi:nucleoside triphosphate hydrolase protein [Wolfiporia cocos MD-104 SS10]|uniref:Nucleoside triphosphate hydrolase protein n=1 Tax=Wolfiporia cocos (strain MD-104) TaxID=742152 RepID=A0A2H3IVF6_WOLCO|nr:nucleoside triphosphate hydrolase protein [Wolfiporia cocos MD-104 SS10]